MSLLGDVPWPWKYNKPNLLSVVDLILQISLMGEKTPSNIIPSPDVPQNQQKQINFVIAFLFGKNNLNFNFAIADRSHESIDFKHNIFRREWFIDLIFLS